MTIDDIYGSLGAEGLGAITRAFYNQVPEDSILGPMYPAKDMEGAETRLREFLIFRCGGPQDYIEHRGHPRLRMRHAPFAIDPQGRDRWVKLMTNALEECAVREPERTVLLDFLGEVATFLVNRSPS